MRTPAYALAGALAAAAFIGMAKQSPERGITPDQLSVRLSAFAHDSMQGRKTGTLGSARATAYVIAELTRLRVTPGAARGQFYQDVPLRAFQLDLQRATLRGNISRTFDVSPRTFPPGIGFLPLTGVFGLDMPRSARVPQGAAPRAMPDDGAYLDVVAGGRLGDSGAIAPLNVSGRIVLLLPPLRRNGQPDYQLWTAREQLASYKDAAAVLVPVLDMMPRSFLKNLTGRQFELSERVAALPPAPPIIAIVPSMATALISREIDLAAVVYASRELPFAVPARNVIAVIEGSDPRVRSEYVVLSAHSDHLGVGEPGERVEGDSIYNGADDGGTGAVALLAVAEQIASRAVKPRRSILFLWTAAAEQGMLGTEYFTDKPPVPRAKIVANITVDMIGRGGAKDITGGGPSYLQVHGPRRASSDYGDWIESVSRRFGFQVDQKVAADGARLGDYCEGVDWHFARWGIPTARISTGRHNDFHRVTDEVERIDFEKYARVTTFIAALATDIADRAARPRVTQPKPDSSRACIR